MDTAERVEAMFDGISYDKGGSVLRMLRAYLNRLQDPPPPLRRSLLQVTYRFPGAHKSNATSLSYNRRRQFLLLELSSALRAPALRLSR